MKRGNSSQKSPFSTKDQSCPLPQTIKAQAPAIKIKVTECSQETAKANDAHWGKSTREKHHKDLFKRQVRNSGAKNHTVLSPSSSVIVLTHNASGDGALRWLYRVTWSRRARGLLRGAGATRAISVHAQRKGYVRAQAQARKRALTRTWIWSWSSSRQNWDNKCLLFKPPSLRYFIMATCADKDPWSVSHTLEVN